MAAPLHSWALSPAAPFCLLPGDVLALLQRVPAGGCCCVGTDPREVAPWRCWGYKVRLGEWDGSAVV